MEMTVSAWQGPRSRLAAHEAAMLTRGLAPLHRASIGLSVHFYVRSPSDTMEREWTPQL